MRQKIIYGIFAVVLVVFVVKLPDIYHRWHTLLSYDYRSYHHTPRKRFKKLPEKYQDVLQQPLQEVQSPQISASKLQELAGHEDPYIRQLVARHPQLTTEILQKLVQDEDEYVKRAILQRSDLSKQTLEVLAEDKDSFNRRLVARHPRVTKAILQKLAHDPIFRVQWEVAQNPKSDQVILQTIAYGSDGSRLTRNEYLLRALAKNSQTPEEILQKIAQQDALISMYLFYHPKLPRLVLEQLSQHYQEIVSQQAQVRLAQYHSQE